MTLYMRLYIRTATIRSAAATSVRSISVAPFLLSNNNTRPISSGLIGLNHGAQDLSTPFHALGRHLFATVSSDEDKTKLASKSKMEHAKDFQQNLFEGLPMKYFTRRTDKLENLFDLSRTEGSVLIIAPPQSGKTALAQLFVEYVKKEHQDVPIEFISFAGYEKDGRRIEGEENEYMEEFIKLSKGITLDELEYKVKVNRGILVTDESHRVYNVDSFWRSFGKAPIKCGVLSFSIYDDYQPYIFAEKRSFPFVAFTEPEFDEVASRFKSNFPNRVRQKAIDFVRDKVHSVYLDNEASFIPPPHKPKTVTLFHPGLTYACFDLIAKYPYGYEEDDIVRELATRDKLYKMLQKMRCFPSFDAIATIFEQEVKKKRIFKAYALPDFDVMFSNIVHSLLATQHVNYNDHHPTQPILLNVLVRHGLCCKNFGLTSEEHVYLSCPLMKTHLQIAYAFGEWPRKPPTLDYTK